MDLTAFTYHSIFVFKFSIPCALLFVQLEYLLFCFDIIIIVYYIKLRRYGTISYTIYKVNKDSFSNSFIRSFIYSFEEFDGITNVDTDLDNCFNRSATVE